MSKQQASQTENQTGKQVEQGIRKIILMNDISTTVILPSKIARKHGLHKGNHVVVKDTEQGILIQKLDLGEE